MAVFLLMASLLCSTFIGVNVGFEEMFVKESLKAVKSVTPGRPSVATMINFVLIALIGILTVIDIKRLRKVSAIFGVVVVATGSIAVLGYIVNRPLLYFAVLGKSSAMAMHTAILFVFWGIGLVLAERDR